MCGIAGIVNLRGAPLHPEADGLYLRGAARQLAHRGPDDERLYFWRNVGMVFRRLSIVDIAGGSQPLFNEDESIVAMTNGEIYNHRDLRSTLAAGHQFRSRSDCEVIVHLYEDLDYGYLSRLNGMFATAILDKRKNRLILARDRFGIKPLYYYHDRQTLVFASEIKAVLAHPGVPRRFAWGEALRFRHTMHYPQRERPEGSFFEDIRQLPAGSFLEIDLRNGKVRQETYWDPVEAAAEAHDPGLGRGGYIERYRELLEESVQLRLMSDVECGMFLSGGIDSVAVACFAAKHEPLQTFSVLSQSTVSNGDAQSAHQAAKRLGLPNHQVLFDWRNICVTPAEWKRILWKLETHMAGAEHVYKYNLHAYARSERPDLKVMLLGTGSDEFNGGYSKAIFNSPDGPSWANFNAVMRDKQRESFCFKRVHGTLMST